MKASLNTDLIIRGESVHVQTEDWGKAHQKIVTRVFRHGQMVKSFELPYKDIHQNHLTQSIDQTVERLHQKVIDWVNEEF